MNMPTRLFALFFLLTSTTQSLADSFQAPMQQAHWEFQKTANACYLIQQIPLYGSADFVHKAGEALRFSIQEQRRKAQIIKASLKIMPAPWIHDVIASRDYPVYLDNSDIGGYGQLSVYGAAAEAMIDGLLMGNNPTFVYIRDAPVLNLEETRVAVSAIKFMKSYKAFSTCRETLVPTLRQNHASLSRKSRHRG
ncbi:MAG: hypothetical protein HOP23_07080 [Methylococcaceae bacterium]|nr:hypothetical protein [Methylococcaceae bacterium]